MKDLWPDQSSENGMKTPATVMKEQVETIAQKTNNHVYADVARADVYIPNNQGLFMYELLFKTPARPRYSYSHFFMTYDIEFYPVEFYISDEQMHHDLELFLGKTVRGPIPAKSEEEFVEILDQILRSEDTQKVINSLAMSNGRHTNGSVKAQ